jgi:choline monooxygenase
MDRLVTSSRLESIVYEFDPTTEIGAAKAPPREWYTEPEMLELDREKVFWKTWQPVANPEELREPQSCKVVDVAGASVLLVRGRDGTLRAMPNQCSHQATLLIDDNRSRIGNCIVCPYHHWTFRDDGRNQSAPHMAGDPRQQDLRQLRVEEWGPYVWVNCDPDAASFDETVGPVGRHIDIEAWKNMDRGRSVTYDVACNWKLFCNNYGDGGYHVRAVHPELASALDDERYRTDIHGRSSVQRSPLVASPDSSVASVRSGTEAQYWWLHPNVMINWYDGGNADVNVMLPDGPDRCRVRFDFYFAKDFHGDRDESIRLADIVQDQDRDVCERVQKGIRSPFFQQRFYAGREKASHHFHRLLSADYRK